MSSDITIGILAPEVEDREILRSQVEALGVGTVSLEVDQYPRALGDRQTARFVDARPEIVIVDMEQSEAALESLKILHQAVPKSWLFVSSSAKESELIVEAMRAGAREYLFKPIPPRSLAQALDRYIAEKERESQKSNLGQIYCVTSSKGGSGATTVAINLASSLAQLDDSKAALIDLNTPVGDAAAYLNLAPEYTVSDALSAASRLDSVLLESYMASGPGFDLLAAPKEFWPESAPGVTASPGHNSVGKLLEVASKTYTHTVIDVTSYLDKDWLQVVLETASASIVLLTPELPALWRTKRLLSFLSSCTDPKKMHLVLNRCRASDEITETEIKRVLNHDVYWKLPNHYNASIEAINSGHPVVTRNHSTLASSYVDLAHVLTGQEPPRKARRFFSFFSKNSGNGE